METKPQLPSVEVAVTVAQATPEKRTGRKSMSRRSGQNGCIVRKGDYYAVRFRQDQEGESERVLRSVRIWSFAA